MEDSKEILEQQPSRRKPTPPRRPPVPHGSMENISMLNGQKKEKPAVQITSNDGAHTQLARAGETVLETFYGMLYKCEDETKEWKLAADSYIPMCFIQERGNVNNPFKVIAAQGPLRVMDFPVTKDTKCTQNKAFVRWHDSAMKMFGARFSKQSQADQFYSAMSRMKSTLLKTSELFKQPERKAMVSQINNPSSESLSHTKISLIVKLPNKETTIMSVPGLILVHELFELICEQENLSKEEHVLNFPKSGGRELKYGPDTVLGSLNAREVFIVSSGSKTRDSSMIETPTSRLSLNGSRSESLTNLHVLPTLNKRFSQSTEQLSRQLPPKVKRRAPKPPQKPPERPKSMPVPRPRLNEHGKAGTSPMRNHSKKRQAPARPPAPKSPRDQEEHVKDKDNNRLPPEFVPPPPPDDIPPPLDECEHPVSPLSDDDETVWMTGSGDLGQSLKKVDTPFQGPHLTPEDPKISPESIPLRFLIPSEVESETDVVLTQGQSSRISFVGDSRSSSVDFSSDDIATSPILDEVMRNPIDLQEIDIGTIESDPFRISPPPLSSELHASPENSNGFVPETIEQDVVLPPPDFTEDAPLKSPDFNSMVVPPPPTMFDDSPEELDMISRKSSTVDENVENFSIPPPMDFAEENEIQSRGTFADDAKPVKKKLGLNTDMFPWMKETQPVFQAEVSSTSENQSSNDILDVESCPEPLQDRFSSENDTSPPPESSNISTKDSEETSDDKPKVENRIEKEQNDELNFFSENVLNFRPPTPEMSNTTTKDSTETSYDKLKVEHCKEEEQKDERNSSPESRNLESEKKIEKITFSDDMSISIAAETIIETNAVKQNTIAPNPDALSSIQNDTSELQQSENEISKTLDEGPVDDYKTPFDDLQSLESCLDSDEDICASNTLYNRDLNNEETKLSNSKEHHDFYPPKTGKESTLSDASVSEDKEIEQVNSNEQTIESSATKIAIPKDILLQSFDLPSTLSETSLQSNEKPIKQVPKEPRKVISSGLKKQSWADIKNKSIQEENKRKSSLPKLSEKKELSVLNNEGKMVERVAKKERVVPENHLQSAKQSNEVNTESSPMSHIWAEIKQQEKIMEEERKRKMEIEKLEESKKTPPQQEISSRRTSSPTTTVEASTDKPKVLETRKPHSYVSSASERRYISDTPPQSFGEKGKTIAGVKRPDIFPVSKTTSISGFVYTTKESVTSNDTSSNDSGEYDKAPKVESFPRDERKSVGAQGVVMRKKEPKDQETAQKRKSVHDMMKMFSTEKHETLEANTIEANPRQSPALRLLEEKMGYRELSPQSDDNSNTTKTEKPVLTEIKAEEQENVKPIIEESVESLPKSDDKEAKESINVSQKDRSSSFSRSKNSFLNPKPYGVLFPKAQSKGVDTSFSSEPSKKDKWGSKSSTIPKSLDILFPKETTDQEVYQNSNEDAKCSHPEKVRLGSDVSSKMSENSGEVKLESDFTLNRMTKPNSKDSIIDNRNKLLKTKHGSLDNEEQLAINTSTSNQKSYDGDGRLTKTQSYDEKSSVDDNISGKVEMRKKSSLPSDPSKRFSMPANLTSSSSRSGSKNLKILMAPQISDVDVVPKGRVAAMMAAWKSEDQ